MALSYDFTDVEGIEELHNDENERAISHSLIMATMSVGIGDLTEDNLQEFYVRIKFLERDGTFMNANDKEYPFTLEMLRKRVGLRTNVGYENRAPWLKRQTKYALENIERKVKKEMGKTDA